MQDYIPRKIDINQKIDTVTVKQFDNDSRFLHVTISDVDLTEGDRAFNLEGCVTSLYIKPEGSDDPEQVSFVTGEVADAENGIVTFLLPGGVTQAVGRYECEVWIYEGNQQTRPVISTKPFLLVVEKSILNSSAIEASQSFSALDEAMTAFAGYSVQVPIIKAKAEKLDHVITPDMFGSDQDIDDTAAIQAAFDALAGSDDIRKLVFTREYSVSGTMSISPPDNSEEIVSGKMIDFNNCKVNIAPCVLYELDGNGELVPPDNGSSFTYRPRAAFDFSHCENVTILNGNFVTVRDTVELPPGTQVVNGAPDPNGHKRAKDDNNGIDGYVGSNITCMHFGNCKGITIQNMRFDGMYYDVYCGDVSDNTVANSDFHFSNIMSENSSTPFNLINARNFRISGVNIKMADYLGTGEHGFYVAHGSEDISIDGVTYTTDGYCGSAFQFWDHADYDGTENAAVVTGSVAGALIIAPTILTGRRCDVSLTDITYRYVPSEWGTTRAVGLFTDAKAYFADCIFHDGYSFLRVEQSDIKNAVLTVVSSEFDSFVNYMFMTQATLNSQSLSGRIIDIDVRNCRFRNCVQMIGQPSCCPSGVSTDDYYALFKNGTFSNLSARFVGCVFELAGVAWGRNRDECSEINILNSRISKSASGILSLIYRSDHPYATTRVIGCILSGATNLYSSDGAANAFAVGNTFVNNESIAPDGTFVTTENLNETLGSFVTTESFDEMKIMPNLSMFERFGVIGDSFSSGEINSIANYNESWPRILADIYGVQVGIYSRRGATTKDVLDNTKTWYSTRGFGAIISDNSTANKCGLFLICTGINDANNDQTSSNIGDYNDIKENPNENNNTFWGNYGKLIARIQGINPTAKIICCCFKRPLNVASYHDYNNAIKELAEYFGLPCIDPAEHPFFSSNFYTQNMVGDHPTAPVYSGYARAISDLVSAAILSDVDYFKDYTGEGVFGAGSYEINLSQSVSVQNGTVTNLASVTLQKGTYLFTLAGEFAPNDTGVRMLGLAGSSGTIGGNRTLFQEINGYAGTGITRNKILFTAFHTVTTDDYVMYFNAYQNSGTSLTISTVGIKYVKIV